MTRPDGVRIESGILTDLEILHRIVADRAGCIFVSPLVNPRTQLGPSSLDLHLGTDLIVTKNFSTTHIDLTAGKEATRMQTREYSDPRSVGASGAFVLHPGEFTLASTLEFIRLPDDIAGRLEGRSSMGRLGLQIHATAGFVDPGFEGTLTFELINSGRLPVKMSPGLRLGQICFFCTRSVQVNYMKKQDSKYGGRLGAEPSHLYEDSEFGGK